MKKPDIAMLLFLAGLWGASYLFMRIGAGEFGAMTMAGARAAGAALLLIPLLASRRDGGLAAMRRHWKPIALVGITNSALPFVLFGFAALSINASLSAIFNAATPLYAAVIGLLWLRERISIQRGLGLAVGFAGVLWLVWDSASFKAGAHTVATGWAVLACLAATFLYAFSAHYSKQRLADVPPLAVASGSQLISALVLAVPAIIYRPATAPSPHAWAALLALTVACTALAYVLFFKLIANVGASRTMTVPFLVPAFGVLWGVLFLGEGFTFRMAVGSGLIVLGTALTTGLIGLSVSRVASTDLSRVDAR
ncbi:DMT family transporter [Undibacterium sp.]|jgi:drug/metabolite transporter (DMT)-like permease|uniref:DMT family transporter n=1 Tax=Undibacterium sp. TaxID=1914977 RepID=UPI002CC20257|nr:DMT family transporter [Undibacterium sp.]HTD05154.1 DMT family transporter [Undibacterium sp.]